MPHPKLCPVCGASPCYLICPTQDPYAGRPWEEHCDHEASLTPHDGWDEVDYACADGSEGTSAETERDQLDAAFAAEVNPPLPESTLVPPPARSDDDILF